MEELDFIIETTKELMDESIKYLEKELLNIRAGKANPNMLSSIKVEYYGVLTLSKENKLPIIVFDINKSGNLKKIIEGKLIGTIVN